jgi:hypothetical protein
VIAKLKSFCRSVEAFEKEWRQRLEKGIKPKKKCNKTNKKQQLEQKTNKEPQTSKSENHDQPIDSSCRTAYHLTWKP